MQVAMLVAQAVDEHDSTVDAPPRPAPGTVAPPSPSGLAQQLESRALADLRDDELVDVIAGWEQVRSAATARQAEAITELAARRGSREQRYVADEVACALACTRRSAQTKVDLADGLAAFPELHDGLSHGAIDVRKARVVLDEVAGAAPSSSREAVREAVATAAHLTAPQLARRVRRIVLAADPAEAARRCGRARADRHVTLEPAGDAMAWIHALLPAVDATAASTTLDALADAAGDEHDPRTLAQRRADAFSDVFTDILRSGTGPRGALPRRQGVRPNVHVTVAATTLLGLDDEPAELGGYGPIPASVARELAQEGTWRRILTTRPPGPWSNPAASRTAPAPTSPARSWPATSRARFPDVVSRPHGATSTTSSRSTHIARRPARPSRRTCTRCAGTITWPRRMAAGQSSGTIAPG